MVVTTDAEEAHSTSVAVQTPAVRTPHGIHRLVLLVLYAVFESIDTGLIHAVQPLRQLLMMSDNVQAEAAALGEGGQEALLLRCISIINVGFSVSIFAYLPAGFVCDYGGSNVAVTLGHLGSALGLTLLLLCPNSVCWYMGSICLGSAGALVFLGHASVGMFFRKRSAVAMAVVGASANLSLYTPVVFIKVVQWVGKVKPVVVGFVVVLILISIVEYFIVPSGALSGREQEKKENKTKEASEEGTRADMADTASITTAASSIVAVEAEVTDTVEVEEDERRGSEGLERREQMSRDEEQEEDEQSPVVPNYPRDLGVEVEVHCHGDDHSKGHEAVVDFGEASESCDRECRTRGEECRTKKDQAEEDQRLSTTLSTAIELRGIVTPSLQSETTLRSLELECGEVQNIRVKKVSLLSQWRHKIQRSTLDLCGSKRPYWVGIAVSFKYWVFCIFLAQTYFCFVYYGHTASETLRQIFNESKETLLPTLLPSPSPLEFISSDSRMLKAVGGWGPEGTDSVRLDGSSLSIYNVDDLYLFLLLAHHGFFPPAYQAASSSPQPWAFLPYNISGDSTRTLGRKKGQKGSLDGQKGHVHVKAAVESLEDVKVPQEKMTNKSRGGVGDGEEEDDEEEEVAWYLGLFNLAMSLSFVASVVLGVIASHFGVVSAMFISSATAIVGLSLANIPRMRVQAVAILAEMVHSSFIANMLLAFLTEHYGFRNLGVLQGIQMLFAGLICLAFPLWEAYIIYGLDGDYIFAHTVMAIVTGIGLLAPAYLTWDSCQQKGQCCGYGGRKKRGGTAEASGDSEEEQATAR